MRLLTETFVAKKINQAVLAVSKNPEAVAALAGLAHVLGLAEASIEQEPGSNEVVVTLEWLVDLEEPT